MGIKDSVTGTTKRLVGEIVGDGRLADDGARQANLGGPADATAGSSYSSDPALIASASGDEVRLAALLGHAALKVWADLPRQAHERLFSAAMDDGVMANDLAAFLHDRHPKTAHPPKPTRWA